MKYDFHPSEMVCSNNIAIEIDNDKIVRVAFTGGCQGNLTAVSRLIEGLTPQQAIERLEGIRCGNKPTSCPDQLAQALKAILARMKP